MSSRLIHKWNSSEESKSSLTEQYLSLYKELKEDEQLLHDYECLIEFDKVLYEYFAAKGYFSAGKLEYTDQEAEMMTELGKYKVKIETDLNLQNILDEVPILAIIRRNLFEAAYAEGKLVWHLRLRNIDVARKRSYYFLGDYTSANFGNGQKFVDSVVSSSPLQDDSRPAKESENLQPVLNDETHVAAEKKAVFEKKSASEKKSTPKKKSISEKRSTPNSNRSPKKPTNARNSHPTKAVSSSVDDEQPASTILSPAAEKKQTSKEIPSEISTNTENQQRAVNNISKPTGSTQLPNSVPKPVKSTLQKIPPDSKTLTSTKVIAQTPNTSTTSFNVAPVSTPSSDHKDSLLPTTKTISVQYNYSETDAISQSKKRVQPHMFEQPSPKRSQKLRNLTPFEKISDWNEHHVKLLYSCSAKFDLAHSVSKAQEEFLQQFHMDISQNVLRHLFCRYGLVDVYDDHKALNRAFFIAYCKADDGASSAPVSQIRSDVILQVPDVKVHYIYGGKRYFETMKRIFGKVTEPNSNFRLVGARNDGFNREGAYERRLCVSENTVLPKNSTKEHGKSPKNIPNTTPQQKAPHKEKNIQRATETVLDTEVVQKTSSRAPSFCKSKLMGAMQRAHAKLQVARPVPLAPTSDFSSPADRDATGASFRIVRGTPASMNANSNGSSTDFDDNIPLAQIFKTQMSTVAGTTTHVNNQRSQTSDNQITNVVERSAIVVDGAINATAGKRISNPDGPREIVETPSGSVDRPPNSVTLKTETNTEGIKNNGFPQSSQKSILKISTSETSIVTNVPIDHVPAPADSSVDSVEKSSDKLVLQSLDQNKVIDIIEVTVSDSEKVPMGTANVPTQTEENDVAPVVQESLKISYPSTNEMKATTQIQPVTESKAPINPSIKGSIERGSCLKRGRTRYEETEPLTNYDCCVDCRVNKPIITTNDKGRFVPSPQESSLHSKAVSSAQIADQLLTEKKTIRWGKPAKRYLAHMYYGSTKSTERVLQSIENGGKQTSNAKSKVKPHSAGVNNDFIWKAEHDIELKRCLEIFTDIDRFVRVAETLSSKFSTELNPVDIHQRIKSPEFRKLALQKLPPRNKPMEPPNSSK